MTYLHDRRNRQAKIRNILIGVSVLLFLFLFQKYFFPQVSFVTNATLSPLMRIGNNLRTNLKNTQNFFASQKALQAENNNLKKDLEEMKATTANYQTLQTDNETLKELLGRKAPNSKFILAGILSKPNKSLYDTLIIDAGKDEGVVVGHLVFAVGNIPIGRVVEVFNTSSKVVLFSTSQEKTDVVVAGSGAFMSLVGRGGGNFEMILPRDFELQEGAEMTMPGINSYILAKVVTILSDPRDSYKKALLASPVNIQELKFVQVEI